MKYSNSVQTHIWHILKKHQSSCVVFNQREASINPNLEQDDKEKAKKRKIVTYGAATEESQGVLFCSESQSPHTTC